MDATKENYEIMTSILEILTKAHCTVQQAEDVLAYTAKVIRTTAPVQFTGKLPYKFL